MYSRGGADLSLGDVTLDGTGFDLASPPETGTLPPGGSAEFTVALDGSGEGELKGSLRFSTSDADEADYTVTLSGSVEAASSVNDFGDSVQADGKCTLREAILNANAGTQVHADCPSRITAS